MPTRVVTIWISATYLALVDIAVSAASNVSYIKRVSLLSFSLTVRARSTVLKDGLCHSLLCFSRSHPFCSKKMTRMELEVGFYERGKLSNFNQLKKADFQNAFTQTQFLSVVIVTFKDNGDLEGS